MQELLYNLLVRLESIGEIHDEVADTVCRDAMRRAMFRAFLRPEADYVLPDDFGLVDSSGTRAVHEAIAEYVVSAALLAPSLGIVNFHQRFAAFQDSSVATSNGNAYDDFFGHQIPRLYDAEGGWLGTG